MTLNAYAIRDDQVDGFAQPFFSPTHGSALRAFADHVNEKGTAANKHPRDFSLYHIGTYDDTTGTLEAIKPARIGTAQEYYQTDDVIPLRKDA